MDKRYWYKYVCVPRNEDLVDLDTFARGLTRTSCQKRRAQAQCLVDPVVDVRHTLGFLVSPSIVPLDRLIKQPLQLLLLLGALGQIVQSTSKSSGSCFTNNR